MAVIEALDSLLNALTLTLIALVIIMIRDLLKKVEDTRKDVSACVHRIDKKLNGDIES